MNIAHLSDLHIFDDASEDAARALVCDIIANLNPANTVVALTGDIIDSPSADQWARAARVVGALVEAGFRVVTSLGNHDLDWMGLTPAREYRELAMSWLCDTLGLEVDEDHWPVVYREKGVTFIACDSNRATRPERHAIATGALGYQQRMRLARECELARRRGDQVVTLSHHSPICDNPTLLMTDRSEFLHALAHRCDVLLLGHLHTAAAWSGVWGIGRIYAADASGRSGRYRVIRREGERWVGEWREVAKKRGDL